MHQALSERKRAILIRSAESRLGAVSSLDSAMHGVERTWNAVRVPKNVARWGLAAGGGVLALLVVSGFFRRGKREVVVETVRRDSVSRSVAMALARGAVKLAPLVVAPLWRTFLSGGSIGDMAAHLNPVRVVSRLLGGKK